MIGNDIVDLVLASTQSNWQRKGYLDKIFTKEEQMLIAAADHPDEMVWRLWSMKESAYKIHNRETGIRKFAPASLCCKLLNPDPAITGSVTINQAIYFTKTEFSSDYVHTVASSFRERLDEISANIYIKPNHPAHYKTLAPDCVSHHGRYLALAYE
jgi:phosphopantetheinyl transferase (holo-ACP synthase)